MISTKEVIERCHLCGVKVYITMNTILYEDEMEDAYNMAKMVHSFGVDALIIQDLGFIHLLHHILLLMLHLMLPYFLRVLIFLVSFSLLLSK